MGATGNNECVEIHEWDKRYRLREHAASDFEAGPTPLLVESASKLAPGRALDLASGTGRNALWLAEQGWDVTAVDGAPTAVETLRGRAAERALAIQAVVADLEKHEFRIEPATWDLIAICYYLQRDLFEPAERGVAPGGILIALVHINEPGEADGLYRLRPGELPKYFEGWKILHFHEGRAKDLIHRRAVAEIVAQRVGAR